ncbi:alpha/beta hydrolase [Paenibacillus mendelii]|uniref:Alpha/beta hydrolase n=1 Tax=Paenibacillus mendelii TaxID=206163 RepID=A0ABV6J794_9BACL|nr:alpha/beta hydrolase [Paenibacillus mendelii]MCQ6562109.1 lysophospholipase [Paenibacillus mendelii]
MRSSQFQLPDRPIHVYKWEPDEGKPLSGIVQLVHGSCEHAGRYEAFAQYLTGQGLVVYANDHRGHGLSVKNNEDFGYFGERDGWDHMVDDLYKLTGLARREHPGLNVTMLGHSMGSFMARHYAVKYGSAVDGMILSGTAHYGRLLLRLARLIAVWEVWSRGSRFHSTFLYRMTYQSFNHRFQPIRTNQDWLTRDQSIVDRFMADERCGFVFTASGFRDMFDGLLYITKPANISQTPKSLPILLLSGTDDPVGTYGKMVEEAYNAYRTVGVIDVNMKLYEGMRHEILNEIGREQVYADILDWLQAHELRDNDATTISTI